MDLFFIHGICSAEGVESVLPRVFVSCLACVGCTHMARSRAHVHARLSHFTHLRASLHVSLHMLSMVSSSSPPTSFIDAAPPPLLPPTYASLIPLLRPHSPFLPSPNTSPCWRQMASKLLNSSAASLARHEGVRDSSPPSFRYTLHEGNAEDVTHQLGSASTLSRFGNGFISKDRLLINITIVIALLHVHAYCTSHVEAYLPSAAYDAAAISFA